MTEKMLGVEVGRLTFIVNSLEDVVVKMCDEQSASKLFKRLSLFVSKSEEPKELEDVIGELNNRLCVIENFLQEYCNVHGLL
jgi:hypothetical protein